jgi:hypothetical protein
MPSDPNSTHDHDPENALALSSTTRRGSGGRERKRNKIQEKDLLKTTTYVNVSHVVCIPSGRGQKPSLA